MFLKSIRFKIILWYMALLTVIFFFFGLAVYHNFSKRVYDDLDELLQSRAEGIADSIDTYWETEKLDAAEKGIKEEALDKVNDANFAKIAQHWVKERSAGADLIDIIIQIFDARGNNIAYSKDLTVINKLPAGILNQGLQGRQILANGIMAYPHGRDFAVRILTIPIVENDKTAYIVQVASPLTMLNASLSRLRAILFLFLPLAIILTGILGAILAQITLKPFNRIIDSIHNIEAESLSLRISVPDTRDEIKRLADTFNEMLTRLDKSFSSQRQFIQDVSHELKTPLTILKGELEVASKRSRSPQEYAQVLGSGLDEINSLIRIVDELLTLARFDSKEISLDIRPLYLSSLLTEVVSDMKVLAGQKGIRINLSGEGEISLEADEKQLKKVFVNLLDNAIKYTPSGGAISIGCSHDQSSVKVRISDTGQGIPENELGNIFNRFYRVDKSRSSPGFGLGLSIAKSLIEAHHGSIEVQSIIDQGTAFIISLPRAFKA